MTNTMRYSAAALALLLTATLSPAEVKEPPRAGKVTVEIRYRIRASRDERIRQYRQLEAHLKSLGFEDARRDDPDRDLDILDPEAERFTGTIPGDKVTDLLKDPRVLNVLFSPAGFTYPQPDGPVAVRLALRAGHLPPVQQKLHRQVVAHLGLLGFKEFLGYDTRGGTLVRGSIPAKNVEQLVKDVRAVPGGWFLPAVPLDQLPSPLRDNNPLRWAEVLPITDFAEPFVQPPVLPAQLKYSADLRALLLDPAAPKTPLRVEVVVDGPITDEDVFRTLLASRFSGASLDGVVGNVASVRVPNPAFVERLAELPRALYIRLPREAHETVTPAPAGKADPAADALKAANVHELHKLGYTGAGVKVILIGSDFTGAEKLIGTDLPKRTKVVDMTTELTPDLLPAKPYPNRSGTGTAAARAVAAAAPDCDLVLVRIDPGCQFLLPTVVRLARGEAATTDALELRLAELTIRATAIAKEKEEAVAAYRAAYSDLSDNELARSKRERTKKELEAVIAREKELATQVNRFNAYQKDIRTALLGARVFVNTLVWESGYPMDALSEFSATLERLANPQHPRVMKRAGDPASLPKPPVIWVQAASNAGASAWGGAFRDANGDGLMEFLPPGSELPPDNWSPQINFLGTRSAAGEVTPELAKGTRLRFVVQWREPTDPGFPESDVPAYPLTLRLWRQLDPEGKSRSSDEMAEAARSVSAPNIVARTRQYLVFEQMLEYTVLDAGRYALVLESPLQDEPAIPALKRDLEINPRIVVETLNTAAGDPRAVFRSYTTFDAGVGMPGDSVGAVTVGVDSAKEQSGAGTGLTLRAKPDVLAPRELAFGADAYRGQGVATGLAGGTAALLVQARFSGANVFKSAGVGEGKKLVIPEKWFRPAQEPRAKP